MNYGLIHSRGNSIGLSRTINPHRGDQNSTRFIMFTGMVAKRAWNSFATMKNMENYGVTGSQLKDFINNWYNPILNNELENQCDYSHNSKMCRLVNISASADANGMGILDLFDIYFRDKSLIPIIFEGQEAEGFVPNQGKRVSMMSKGRSPHRIDADVYETDQNLGIQLLANGRISPMTISMSGLESGKYLQFFSQSEELEKAAVAAFEKIAIIIQEKNLLPLILQRKQKRANGYMSYYGSSIYADAINDFGVEKGAYISMLCNLYYQGFTQRHGFSAEDAEDAYTNADFVEYIIKNPSQDNKLGISEAKAGYDYGIDIDLIYGVVDA